jgi:hypothetical protein
MNKKKITLPYKYDPRPYQVPAWGYFQGDEPGKRGICVWHRRAGKDLFSINLVATQVMRRVGVYWHLLPTYRQGRNIVWNGFTRNGRSFLDHFPPELIEKKLDNEMRIHFKHPTDPTQPGSIYQVVGTDDVDLLVGTNPIGCIFSEYSLQNPSAWDYISPILRENGGWALFIFTPRGKNHGYDLAKMAQKNKDWLFDRRVAGNNGTKLPDGTPVLPDSEIEKERKAGKSEAFIQQEYFCSFDAPMEGAYYAQQMNKAMEESRITKIPHEEMLPVDTYWDIGMKDSTSIVFVQTLRTEHRIIDYYEADGEGLPHYKRILNEKASELGYNYGRHYAPWDIQIREFSSGRTRLEKAKDLGIKFQVAEQISTNEHDGIENVRAVLGKCWFDEGKCDRLIEALRSYRKEWDEKHRRFRDKPLHDWSSHAADAMRVFAWFTGKRKYLGKRRLQETAIDDYAYI